MCRDHPHRSASVRYLLGKAKGKALDQLMSYQIGSTRIKQEIEALDVAGSIAAVPPHIVVRWFYKLFLLFFAHQPSFTKLAGSFQLPSSNRRVGSTITCFFASSLIANRGSDRFAGGLITRPSSEN